MPFQLIWVASLKVRMKEASASSSVTKALITTATTTSDARVLLRSSILIATPRR